MSPSPVMKNLPFTGEWPYIEYLILPSDDERHFWLEAKFRKKIKITYAPDALTFELPFFVSSVVIIIIIIIIIIWKL
jgi:hypothetical protein